MNPAVTLTLIAKEFAVLMEGLSERLTVLHENLDYVAKRVSWASASTDSKQWGKLKVGSASTSLKGLLVK